MSAWYKTMHGTAAHRRVSLEPRSRSNRPIRARLEKNRPGSNPVESLFSDSLRRVQLQSFRGGSEPGRDAILGRRTNRHRMLLGSVMRRARNTSASMRESILLSREYRRCRLMRSRPSKGVPPGPERHLDRVLRPTQLRNGWPNTKGLAKQKPEGPDEPSA